MSMNVICVCLVGLALGEGAVVNNRALLLQWTRVVVILAQASLVGLGMASQTLGKVTAAKP